ACRDSRIRRRRDGGGEARLDGRGAGGGRTRGRLARTSVPASRRSGGRGADRAGGGFRGLAPTARGGSRAAPARTRVRGPPLGRRRPARLRRPPRRLG